MQFKNIALIFLVMFFCSILWISRRDLHGSDAKVAFEKYLTALNKGDYEGISDFLLEKDRALFGSDKETQIRNIKHAINPYPYKKMEAEIHRIKYKSKNEAIIVYNIRIGDDLVVENLRCPMIKIDGSWKLNSSEKRSDENTKSHFEEFLSKQSRLKTFEEIFEKQKKYLEEKRSQK